MSTGITRKIDQLGRLVLPMELRRNLNIGEGDYMDISTDGNRIIVKKYQRGCYCCGKNTNETTKVYSLELCEDCINTFNNAKNLINKIRG